MTTAREQALRDTTMLNIELHSSCNLRCKWCALDHDKPAQSMERRVLARVFEELQQGALPGLRFIDFHNGGETLLHPRLPEMLAVVRRYRQRTVKRPVIRTLSNAMLLTEKKAMQILECEAFDVVRFSVDGASPREYEDIRRGAKWEVLKKNVLRFLALRKHLGKAVRVEAICLVADTAGLSLAPETEALLAQFDKVELRPPHNWDGSVDLGVDDASYRETAQACAGSCCFLLRHNLVVLPDGQVTVCCNDLNARGVIGSVLEQGLKSLALDPERLRMQELHRAGRKSEVALCSSCSGFYSNKDRS